MKIGYSAINRQTGSKVDFYAYSTQTAQKLNGLDAYHWIVNHLDCSFEWSYFPNGKFRFDLIN